MSEQDAQNRTGAVIGNAEAIEEAARLFVEARRTGRLLDALPASCRPATVDDAHAIQEATIAALSETVGGWKVAAPIDGQIVRGALLRSRMVDSPARVQASAVPLLGVEAEIAFRFVRDFPPRDDGYTYDNVAGGVIAFAAIEVVDSRFRNYPDPPLLHRIADCVSNGAFVAGTPRADWRGRFDLARLHIELSVDNNSIVRRIGGHPTVDPLLPAVALVNDLRKRSGVREGQVMTTGTYTGLNFAKPGQIVTATFEGFGSASVEFVA